MWRRLRWESLARSFCCCVISSHRSNSFGPNFSRGSISRTTRYTCGRVSRGIFPPKPIPRWDVHFGVLKTTERIPQRLISPHP